MTPRQEHKKKIYDTVEALKKPNLSHKRRHDLRAYLTRLNKELKYYDSYRSNKNE